MRTKITRVFAKSSKTWKIVWSKDTRLGGIFSQIIAFANVPPLVESLLQQSWSSEPEVRRHVQPKYDAFIADKLRQGYRLVSEEGAAPAGKRISEPKLGRSNRKLLRGISDDPRCVAMKFGAFTRQPSPHRAGMATKDVFVANTTKIGRMFSPLLCVDLAAIDRRLRGQVHFVDHNPNAGDTAIEFSLERGRDGRTRLAFVGGIEEIDEVSRPRRGYVGFREVVLPPVPRGVLQGTRSWLGMGQVWIDALRANMDAVQERSMMGCALGGFPRWAQADATPRCCSSLTYVGQVGASELGGYDQHLYLFHCPKHRIQIQVAQST